MVIPTAVLTTTAVAFWALSPFTDPRLPNEERHKSEPYVGNCVTTISLVVLGASYAKGWAPPAGPIRLLNAGHEGDESSRMLERFERDVVQSQPRGVILWGFINDIFRSPREQVASTVAGTRVNIMEMVKMSRAKLIEPVLATEVTVRGPNDMGEKVGHLLGRLLRKTSYQDFINGHVRETNTWIRALAASEKILLLDFEQALADVDGRRKYEFAASDGSHISQAGYGALTEVAMPLLSEHFCDP